MRPAVALACIHPGTPCTKHHPPRTPHLICVCAHLLPLQHLGELSYLQHREDAEPVVASAKEKVVYYRIANHYK